MTDTGRSTAMIVEDESLAIHRAQYATLDRCTYLNFGARGVLPLSARDAILSSLDTMQSVGPASRAAAAWIEYEVAATRADLGRLVGAPPDRIAIVDSVSSACALAILGIPWRTGDHALLCDSEPPGTWATLRQVADRFGIRFSSFSFRDGTTDAACATRLLEELRPTTRLVIVSHVDWITGCRRDLSRLQSVVRQGPCPEARILIDGAQSVGVLPVNVATLGVDLYAFGGQKWLGGPDGIAALFVSESAQLHIQPTLVGWRGVEPTADGLDLRLARDARRFESGTCAYALLAGLRQAVAAQESFAPLALRSDRILQLNRRLRSKLRAASRRALRDTLHVLGEDSDSGITTFTIAGTDPAELVRRLERAGLIVRQHFTPPSVRACVHYLTLDREIDQFCDELVRACTDGAVQHRHRGA